MFKILSKPGSLARQFLSSHDFYQYQQTDQYLAQLDRSILKIKSLSYPYQLVLPFPKSSPKKNPTQIRYCLELGGTFLKLYKFEQTSMSVRLLKKRTIAFFENKTYTPESFFADLTGYLQQFSNSRNLRHLAELTLVLAFPLQPVQSGQQIDGKLLAFGKNHRQKDLLNLHIGKSWEKYLQQNFDLNLKINVINDSTANLLAGYEKISGSHTPVINLIAGTGTNLSLSLPQSGKLKIFNLEFGKYSCFPASSFDLKLRSLTRSTPDYDTEKMFSGAWQNRLFELIHQQLLKEKLIRAKKYPPASFAGLSSKELEAFFSRFSFNRDYNLLKKIWQELDRRGAFLCALSTARLIHLNLPQTRQLTLSLQGGIAENSRIFQEYFQKYLDEFLSLPAPQIKFVYKADPAPLASRFFSTG